MSNMEINKNKYLKETNKEKIKSENRKLWAAALMIIPIYKESVEDYLPHAFKEAQQIVDYYNKIKK